MQDILCVTCQKSLREYGKLTHDSQFAYCSICEAVYQIVPVIDEAGQPKITPQGDVMFYLNPVKPGRPEFAPDERTEPERPDFSDLLKKIEKAHGPKDLLA